MANFIGAEIPPTVEAGGYAVPVGRVVAYHRDGIGPVLTPVEPTPPNLPSPGRSIVFDVIDADGFAAICALAEYGTGAYEVIHDGDKFGQVYAAQSTRSTIAGGFRYSVKRAGGWFGGTVTIRIIAVDVGGAVG